MAFSEQLIWEESCHLHLATTPKEFIGVFRLRSEIYSKLNYTDEFPDMIRGLNFDDYDENSAILYTKKNGVVTGTCRLIFDSSQRLPIDKRLSLDSFRYRYIKIAEVSRFTVKHQKSGLSQEFKLLIKGIYQVGLDNSVSNIVSVIRKEHFQLYKKFGGFTIEHQFNSYGEISNTIVMTSWRIFNISNFFRRAFLKKREVA